MTNQFADHEDEKNLIADIFDNLNNARMRFEVCLIR